MQMLKIFRSAEHVNHVSQLPPSLHIFRAPPSVDPKVWGYRAQKGNRGRLRRKLRLFGANRESARRLMLCPRFTTHTPAAPRAWVAPVRLGTMQRRARSTVSSANLALYCLSSTQPSLPQKPFPQRRQTSKVLIPTKRKTAAGSRSLFRLSAIASAPPSCRPASSSADASLVLPAASECFVWE